MLNPRNYKHIIGGKEHLKRGAGQHKYNKTTLAIGPLKQVVGTGMTSGGMLNKNEVFMKKPNRNLFGEYYFKVC